MTGVTRNRVGMLDNKCWSNSIRIINLKYRNGENVQQMRVAVLLTKSLSSLMHSAAPFPLNEFVSSVTQPEDPAQSAPSHYYGIALRTGSGQHSEIIQKI